MSVSRRGFLRGFIASAVALVASRVAPAAGETVAPIPPTHRIEIGLFDTYVAGTTHVTDIKRIVADMAYGSVLDLERDYGNVHDPDAIRVTDAYGRKVGWIPATDNELAARLLDGEQVLRAQVKNIELRGSWNRIAITVFLEDLA